MKLYKSLLVLSMVAVAGLFTACSEDGYWDKYSFENDTYSFEQASHSYNLKATDNISEVKVTVVRGTTEGNADIPVILTANSEIITLAEGVAHFTDGSSKAELTVLIEQDKIEMGVNYKANITFDVPEVNLSISGATTYTLSFVVDYNWVAAGKGIYQSALFGEQMECTFEMAEGYKGGYYCRVAPFKAGYYIPFYLDEAGNAVSIPVGVYNMGITVNGASFAFYYDPASNYGSYCKPFKNNGNIYEIFGVWNSGGNPAWIASDAFMWTEGWPGESAE